MLDDVGEQMRLQEIANEAVEHTSIKFGEPASEWVKAVPEGTLSKSRAVDAHWTEPGDGMQVSGAVETAIWRQNVLHLVIPDATFLSWILKTPQSGLVEVAVRVKLCPGLIAAIVAIVAALIAIPVAVVAGYAPQPVAAHKAIWVGGLVVLVIVLGVLTMLSVKTSGAESAATTQ